MSNALRKKEYNYEDHSETNEDEANSFMEGILSLKNDDQFGKKYKRTEKNTKNIQSEKEEDYEFNNLLSLKKEEVLPQNIIKDATDETDGIAGIDKIFSEDSLLKEVKKNNNIEENMSPGLSLKEAPTEVPNKTSPKNAPSQEEQSQSTNMGRSNIFYKVSNHQELFKVGTSFMSDYESGINSFAICSTGYQTSQQKMILGLASFFDYRDNIKIAIISDNLYDGLFQEIIKSSREETLHYDDEMASCKVHIFHDHFEFICLDSLLQQNHQDADVNYEERIEEFKSNYDIIFWDVPELHKIQLNPEIYYPMIMNFDCLSIIVAQALSKKEDIEELRSFFSGYGINLKGLIIDKNGKEKNKRKKVKDKNKSPRKPWWRFFK